MNIFTFMIKPIYELYTIQDRSKFRKSGGREEVVLHYSKAEINLH